ncbi:MAG: hypothetical protein HZA17_02175, partial [Nitrospirae bacterium]|nr:hypothetical protein [Nitrospirota bacterium]
MMDDEEYPDTYEDEEEAIEGEELEDEVPDEEDRARETLFFEGENDPIRIYLKEMGGVPLLTKDGERDIAVRIEKEKEKVSRIIFSLPFVLKKLISLGEIVERGEAPLEEIILNGEDGIEEDLLLERKGFFEGTLKIKPLYEERKLLHRQSR